MNSRIYEVKSEAGTRLVDAATSAQALRHVVNGQFTVEVASAKRIAEIMTAGATKVEKAGDSA